MPKQSDVTVIDIARRAHVSQATVSAALHGRGRVGEECKKRIELIARKMGYEPKIAAQLLRAKRSGHLGLIVAAADGGEALSREVQRLVIGHFVTLCGRQEIPYHIEFHHHLQDERQPFAPPQQVTARLVDGTILVGDVGDQLRSWLADRPDFAWVSVEEPAPLCVLSASDEACAEAMEMLGNLGHRRFGYVGGLSRYSQHRLAFNAFKTAARQMGVEKNVRLFPGEVGVVDEAQSARMIKEWATQLLAKSDRPTAMICHGEPLARSVLMAATELHLRVPEDLSVISYGSRYEAQRRFPQLTTIENDYEEISRQALEMLRDRIAKRPIENPVRRIRPKIIPGVTIGPSPV